MNRRELLGVAAAVPLATVAFGSEGMTLQRLTAKIERRFQCVEGPARAYFEGVYPSGEFGRALYQSFVNGMAVGDGQPVDGLDSEAQALDALWKSFEAYAIGKKGKLYWRARPRITISTPEEQMVSLGLVETRPGRWHTPEVVEDGLTTEYMDKTPAEWGHPTTKYYARMRLIVTDLMLFTEREHDGPYKVDRPSGEVWQRAGKVSL